MEACKLLVIPTNGNPGLGLAIPQPRFGFSHLRVGSLALLLLAAQGCASLEKSGVPDRAKTEKAKIARVSTGPASWYGPGFIGRKTASGEIFDDTKFTAAHRTLPLGSRVKVTNLENGRSVRVQINDRGPYAGNRIIDLSRAAARALGMVDDGVAPVRIELHEDDGVH